jgi:hypothetical protein
MIVPHFRRYVVRALVLGAALIALGFHFRYARQPATMDDLLRVSYVVPYAASHSFVDALRQAVKHDLNYVHQAILYYTFKETGAHTVTWYRALDGAFALLAVIWIYRVGSLCCSTLTGVGAAFALAFTPPAIWGYCALQILVVLLHAEFLLLSIRRDTLVYWVIWSGLTVLLFMNGVFAEPLLLQTWFIALVLAWCVWYYGVRVLPEHEGFAHGDYRRGERRSGSLWDKLRLDSGFSRFAVTVFGVAAVILVLCFVGATFFSDFSATFENFVKLVMVVLGLTLMVAVALLLTPLFARERNTLLDWLTNLRLSRTLGTPEMLFQRIMPSTLLHALFAYSCAVLLFLPVFYTFRQSVNIYVADWEFGRFLDFMRQHGGWQGWISFGLPLLALALAVTGYFTGLFSRARLVGTTVLLVLCSAYLVQQRYALYAAPFHLILSVGAFAAVLDMVIAVLPFARTSSLKELEDLP